MGYSNPPSTAGIDSSAIVIIANSLQLPCLWTLRICMSKPLYSNIVYRLILLTNNITFRSRESLTRAEVNPSLLHKDGHHGLNFLLPTNLLLCIPRQKELSES